MKYLYENLDSVPFQISFEKKKKISMPASFKNQPYLNVLNETNINESMSVTSQLATSSNVPSIPPRSPLNDLLDTFDSMDVSSDSVDAVRKREIEKNHLHASSVLAPRQVDDDRGNAYIHVHTYIHIHI